MGRDRVIGINNYNFCEAQDGKGPCDRYEQL